jgi:hypothetical protein
LEKDFPMNHDREADEPNEDSSLNLWDESYIIAKAASVDFD